MFRDLAPYTKKIIIINNHNNNIITINFATNNINNLKSDSHILARFTKQVTSEETKTHYIHFEQ